MKDYFDKEQRCTQYFNTLGQSYHLWTPENFEIIFRKEDEFKIGMGIIAVAAKCHPEVKVITFELMTNHLHVLATGLESDIREMFAFIKRYLIRMSENAGRTIDWKQFQPGIRKLNSISDVRNVLIYDNRNGFLVRPEYSPFSYPWGANSCYFNPDSKKRYHESAKPSTIKDRRAVVHSHIVDNIQGLNILDGAFSPYSFCHIKEGENLFRDAAHYFYSLSKNIERNIQIAKELGESISYTEEELYSAISMKCKEIYGTPNPAQIPSAGKMEVAKMMHSEYNATIKQIQRILRMDANVLMSLFGSVEGGGVK